MKLMNKKANAYIWLASIASLVIIAIVYLPLTGVVNAVDDATANDRITWTTSQNTTWDRIYTSWNWWPAVMIFGILIWAIARTISTDQFGGYR